MPDETGVPSRPGGIAVLATLTGLLGLQSILGAVWSRSENATSPLTWVELATAVTSLAAAYGLWQRRRWARYPFILTAALLILVHGAISMFGAGEIGGTRGWVVGVLLVTVGLVAAGALIRYVWRWT